ncbi:allatotropin receptor [Danaus plexippus plexippus]|uniref:Allatotropin receptor n=1 Tax=Danaus plexippus plexippus TaxID=278856 RepID=A0A212FAI2_DANPL|nr:orexin receptor type 1-like [Danaus plexippus plexippus]OWR50755.1 allatotropin receptor [Danaus plexippus plexippus]
MAIKIILALAVLIIYFHKNDAKIRFNGLQEDFMIESHNNDIFGEDTFLRLKRSVEQDKKLLIGDNNKSKNEIESNSSEPCVGDAEFCNMTREDYIQMLYEYIYPQTYEWVLIGVHTTVFVIGLIGNLLVCLAVYRNHAMRTVTNYFLVNLAVADFMVLLFCLPATVLWDVTETWFLGDALCKILLYIQSVSVTVSVLTLTFISVDRWYAICFPLKFKSTINSAKTAILVIWALSLVFNTPELVVLTTVKVVPLRFDLEYLVQCTATWSYSSDLIWHIIRIVFVYTVPLLLMTVAYHQIVRVLWSSQKIPGLAETMKLASAEQIQLQSRRKAAKMLVAVVVMFAVCYFPVHLLSVLRYLDMEQNDMITCLALVSHVLCYVNSAINPLIYNFMSGKYRREFRRVFCCNQNLTRNTFTTMTRLTTSRKKYETADKTQRSSLKFHKCENMALRHHNCGLALKSQCGHIALNERVNELNQGFRVCENVMNNGQRCSIKAIGF